MSLRDVSRVESEKHETNLALILFLLRLRNIGLRDGKTVRTKNDPRLR